MAKEKPIMNVVFVGHVDQGKSTSVGRVFYDGGAVSEQEMKRFREEAEKHGKQGFEFAYVMDNLKEERERGVTINLSYKKLKTQNYEVTIIDAPGHKDFVKNMITGASQADAAFLVVGCEDSVQPQTKEHVWLLRTMGVKNLAVLINKMDVVKYDEARFNKTVEEVKSVVQKAGYKIDDVVFIPASALMGDNIAKKSENMAWYKGPTVLEQIDKFPAPEKPVSLPMRMPIQDVYEITGIGTVPVGKVETGIMKVGQKIVVLPGRSGTGVQGEVRSIEAHHEQLKEAEAGDNVGVNLRGVGKKDMARGDVICDAASPAKIVEEFEAQVVVINHPTVIAKGYTPVFHVHTAQVPCQFVELVSKLDPASGQVLQEHPDFLKNGDAAIVKIRPIGNLVLETVKDNPYMARFAIRDAGVTVAAGVCKSLVEKKK
ncbi:MAG: translation elongation factor EF-1 subunit alpha [Candidatus Pacearchaeota archaeon]